MYLQKVPVGKAVIRVRVRVRFIQFKVPVLAPLSTFGGDILSWSPLVIFYIHLGGRLMVNATLTYLYV